MVVVFNDLSLQEQTQSSLRINLKNAKKMARTTPEQ